MGRAGAQTQDTTPHQHEPAPAPQRPPDTASPSGVEPRRRASEGLVVVERKQPAARDSKPPAAGVDELFEACYTELRRLARRYLSSERPERTLQTTDLVHEAYLRLVRPAQMTPQNRAHFFAVSSTAMRRILVDAARRRRSVKRGGKLRRVPIEDAIDAPAASPTPDLLTLDLALSQLEAELPEEARIVEMAYFGGMLQEEIAAELAMAPRTVRRRLAYAQARLNELMRE